MFSDYTDASLFEIDDSRESMNRILAEVSLSPIRSQTRKTLESNSHSGLRRITSKFSSTMRVLQSMRSYYVQQLLNRIFFYLHCRKDG